MSGHPSFFNISTRIRGVNITEISNYVNDNSRTGDIYCSAIGSNTNNGTAPSTPKATLANVLSTYSNSFAAADTIFADAGTYTNTDVNLTSPKNVVVIKGAGPTLTIFNYSSGDGYFMKVTTNNTQLINFQVFFIVFTMSFFGVVLL